MQTVSILVIRHAPRIAMLVFLLGLACAALALVALAGQILGVIQLLTPEGLPLAPFRWDELPPGLT